MLQLKLKNGVTYMPTRQYLIFFSIVIFIISSFCSPTKAQTLVGNLNVTVQNLDASFKAGAPVFRYNSAKQYIDKKSTGSNGVASWTDIAVGTFYLEAYADGNVLPYLGEEFWGYNFGEVTSGGIANVGIKRNEPYAQSIVFKNNSTNEILTTSNPIPLNTTIRVEVTVKNEVTIDRMVKVEILIDRDKLSTYDFDISLVPKKIAANGNISMFAIIFTPTIEGIYYRGLKIESFIETSYKLTDTWAWGLPDGVFKVNRNAINFIQDNNGQVPEHFALMQNYPNPFNPSTTIKYSVPVVDAYYASTRLVQLKVYDALGREVATLVNEEKQPGTYEVKFNVETLQLSRLGLAKSNGVSLSSGVYYYQLSADNYNEVKKLLFIK